MAHHSDDQAETTLFRMIRGYSGVGLRSTKAISPIPECHGIYGVAQSGKPRSVAFGQNIWTKYDRSPPILIEAGGVNIHRPLLECTKTELMAVCLSANVPWFEDETNADRTLTPRNAIRQLLRSNRLPAAFNSHSLKRLATKIGRTVEAHENAVDEAFKSCQIELNVGAGTTKIICPGDLATRLMPGNETHDNSAVMRLRLALLVRRLVELVSPAATSSLQNMDKAVEHMTAALFAPLPRSFNDRVQVSDVLCNIAQIRHETGPKIAITTSRRPPTKRERQTCAQTLIDPRDEVGDPCAWRTTDWKLFDGRFWIRIHYRARGLQPGCNLNIRFMDQDDLARLNLHELSEALGTKLMAHAPGHVRYTLPVLVKSSSNAANGDVYDSVIAVPSLNWSLPGWLAYENELLEGCCYWEIRYKKV